MASVEPAHKRARTAESNDNDESKFQGRVAVVCASNQNRSVEAHHLLVSKGYRNIYSYGTGQKCRLPGPSIDRPNVYNFGTPYKTIYEDLLSKDPSLYERNGILNMLRRNMSVKEAPEKFQHEFKRKFDIVIAYETRVFDAVLEEFNNRDSETFEPVYVIGMHVKDNHKEAARGAEDTLTLLSLLEDTEGNWKEDIESVLEAFRKRTGKMILSSVEFY